MANKKIPLPVEAQTLPLTKVPSKSLNCLGALAWTHKQTDTPTVDKG